MLADLRAYHGELERLFPQNKHVDAKVRQTLQLLRDCGVLEFLGGGRYRQLDTQPQFSCRLDTSVASDYKSRSQKARVIIEPWAEQNLYCLDCPSDDISALPNNTKVADLRCPLCGASYQIKSSASRMANFVQGGQYDVYQEAARNARFPNLMLVEWDPRFSYVFVVRAIRGSQITEDRIHPRNKLTAKARLPSTGLITPTLREPEDCRANWRG